jgi:DNA-binding transcriptional regulator YbjK
MQGSGIKKPTEKEHRHKSEIRRQLVVEAIIRSLADHGLNHTTFESVGKIAKMRRSHIVYYFANHDEMLQGAIQHVAQTAQELTRSRVESAKSAEDKLKAIISSVFDHILLHPDHAAVLTVYYHLCTNNTSHRQLNSAIREIGTERLVGVIRELLPEKHAEPVYRSYAKAVQALLFGSLLEHVSTSATPKLAEKKSETEKAVFVLLGLREWST